MRGQDSALSANSAKGPIKVEQLTADLQAGLVPKVGAHMISEVDTQIHWGHGLMGTKSFLAFLYSWGELWSKVYTSGATEIVLLKFAYRKKIF